MTPGNKVVMRPRLRLGGAGRWVGIPLLCLLPGADGGAGVVPFHDLDAVEIAPDWCALGGESRTQARLGASLDEVAWGHYEAGAWQEAVETLGLALEADPTNTRAYYRLGQAYEALADDFQAAGDPATANEWLIRAEAAYVAGIGFVTHGENASGGAAEALYERRNGSRDGVESYLSTLDVIAAKQRRDRVLSRRIEDTEPYPRFRLRRLGGGRLDSRDLQDKIVVLHFWGTWCPPCIPELPDFREFARRYAEDPDVRVLSIHGSRGNRKDRDETMEFMDERGLDFEVLMNGDYSARVGVRGWPFSLFADEKGQIRYVQCGATGGLAEEFGWRVEALRQAMVDTDG
ncbi:redoxin domain-containing protein [Candidatus Palauibacter sp.]|uniref:redoxin domain-containing protein n=1 Tax=Candidatus Palauibacter sp. TaxID=3101350 RepID=UPI003AF30FA6